MLTIIGLFVDGVCYIVIIIIIGIGKYVVELGAIAVGLLWIVWIVLVVWLVVLVVLVGWVVVCVAGAKIGQVETGV